MDLARFLVPFSPHSWTVPHVTATGLPVVLWVVVVTILVVHTFRRRKLVLVVPSSSTSCANPDCIRCRRYRHVQQSAIRRLPWVIRQVHAEFAARSSDDDDHHHHHHGMESLDRILDSIRHPRQFCTAHQAPTVLMVRDLPSKEVVTDFHHQPAMRTMLQGGNHDCRLLPGLPFLEALLDEISRLPSDLWKCNDTPSSSTESGGTWEVVSLLNQGQWDSTVQANCPRFDQWVRGLPNLLDGCLFGNAMISKIYAGTDIEPHCGPTNVRHRLQYTLTVPPLTSSVGKGPLLQVGGGRGTTTTLTWRNPGEFFIFDDSMVHSVHYPDKELPDSGGGGTVSSERPSRTVLIVDLWHPHLTLQERALVRYMYPPYSKKETKVD